jgi:hypothetical protein
LAAGVRLLEGLPVMRLYEWRDAAGMIYGQPALAENACTFRLASMQSGQTIFVSAEKVKPENVLHLYVSATGERVETHVSEHGTKCRGVWEGAVWYDAKGRS